MRTRAKLEAAGLVAGPARTFEDQPFGSATGMPPKSYRDAQVSIRQYTGHVSLLICPSSCLYHAINILLNRAKLKLSREPKLASVMAEHNPLIKCLSSATSIVTLFSLYKRTFGEGHVVLSLAYSVYTAASIFLLEIQAIGHVAPITLERLSICIGALDRLRQTNPGTTTMSLPVKLTNHSSHCNCLKAHRKRAGDTGYTYPRFSAFSTDDQRNESANCDTTLATIANGRLLGLGIHYRYASAESVE